MKVKIKFRITRWRFRLLGIWIRISTYKYLKYDLEDPDDWHDYKQMTKASSICSALYEFDQWLKDQVKYANGDGLSKHHALKYWTRVEALQEARDQIRQDLYDKGVIMDDIC